MFGEKNVCSSFCLLCSFIVIKMFYCLQFGAKLARAQSMSAKTQTQTQASVPRPQNIFKRVSRQKHLMTLRTDSFLITPGFLLMFSEAAVHSGGEKQRDRDSASAGERAGTPQPSRTEEEEKLTLLFICRLERDFTTFAFHSKFHLKQISH